MTQIAKAIIKDFYGNHLRHAYFAGCSNGGRQALMEAQRFPRDYDGILAGASNLIEVVTGTPAQSVEDFATANPAA